MKWREEPPDLPEEAFPLGVALHWEVLGSGCIPPFARPYVEAFMGNHAPGYCDPVVRSVSDLYYMTHSAWQGILKELY